MSLDQQRVSTALKKVMAEWGDTDLSSAEWSDVAAEFIAELGETPTAPLSPVAVPALVDENTFALVMQNAYQDLQDLVRYGRTEPQRRQPIMVGGSGAYQGLTPFDYRRI